MSVQANGHKIQQVNNSEVLTSPKKRKYGADLKESSKKKKKARIEHEDFTTGATTMTADGLIKKKKKKKSKEAKTQIQESVAGEASPAPIEDTELPEPAAEEVDDSNKIATPVEEDIDGAEDIEEVIGDLLDSADPTCFYSTRISLYVSIPAIALETSSSSVLATHLAPLLLTYFPPVGGIVLGFSDPVLSAKPGPVINVPLISPHTNSMQSEGDVLARTADELGVSWVWLTVNLLIFRPERGDELYGWTNVTSEGFVGLVSYNYFQAAVGSSRIPTDWKWNGPTQEDTKRNRKKARRAELDEYDQQALDPTEIGGEDFYIHDSRVSDDHGTFTDGTGAQVDGILQFRVLDTEVVPAHDRHKWSLQIDGTLLDDEAEKHALLEDRARFDRMQQRSQLQTLGDGLNDAFMSGARRISREGSTTSRMSRNIAT